MHEYHIVRFALRSHQRTFPQALQRKGLKCFVPAWRLMSWCICINGGWHSDKAWCFVLFFSNNNYGAKSVTWNTPLNMLCMRMTCDSHTNLIPQLQFFMIPIPTPILLGLIPILILIPGITKIDDSNSNSDSSRKWVLFWFRFQCFPKWLDSDSDSSMM